MSEPEPMDGSANLAWLDDALRTGEIGRYGPARSRAFEAVERDRGGEVVRHLLVRAVDCSPDLRLTVLAFLTDLCPQSDRWPMVAEAAAAALNDPDERVRRAAAWFYAAATDANETMLRLFGSADPITRTALAEASWLQLLQRSDHGDRWGDMVERMRRDQLASVRFLGACAALLTADPPDWPMLDIAVRADLVPAAEALGGEGGRISRYAGEMWAIAFTRRDREQDAYATVARLVGAGEGESVRQAGLAIAAEAMRRWRAAPTRLAPVLSAVLTEPPSAVRTAAVDVVCASLGATRLLADQLTSMLAEPAMSTTIAVALGCVGEPRAIPELLRLLRRENPHPRLADALATVATAAPDPTPLVQTARQTLADHPKPCHEAPHGCPALVAAYRLTGDRRIADDYLAARPEKLRRCRIAPDLFDWLAQHGGLTDRQVRQLNHLFNQRGWAQARSATAYWRHHGPSVAPLLLSTLARYLDEQAYAQPAMKALAAMGPHAQPVVPVLDRLIAARHRAPMYLGNADVEMRADEELVQLALATRAQVTATPR
ncbi:hypothetical protein [Micromonospora sp. DT229]|uniref:hypothetical protein n=1 Tax=Micromonospora sp. DT229 TaxID=3393430 RepID=UPI003CF383AE